MWISCFYFQSFSISPGGSRLDGLLPASSSEKLFIFQTKCENEPRMTKHYHNCKNPCISENEKSTNISAQTGLTIERRCRVIRWRFRQFSLFCLVNVHTKKKQNYALEAGGKPSTWFPPESLVERSGSKTVSLILC